MEYGWETMAEQVIICPHCQAEIPLTEALAHQFAGKIQTQVRKELELELKDKDNEAAELRQQNKNFQVQILELTKSTRELRKSEQERELEMQKKLTAEEEKIRLDSRKQAEEGLRLKMLEMEKKLTDAISANDELRRKLEQGSQQTQGEVQELLLEKFLKDEFPQDMIEPVTKGVRGGDVIQTVFDKNGWESGKILWESKQTKAWSHEWVNKLKEDQRAAGADLAVLISAVLPPKVKNLGYHGGIWVTNLESALGASWILRYHLIQAAGIRQAASATGEKKDELYEYVTGNQFKHRVEAMMDAYGQMFEDMEREKRWFTSKWARLEKQLHTLMEQTGSIHGELAGIIGAALPKVKSFELDEPRVPASA